MDATDHKHTGRTNDHRVGCGAHVDKGHDIARMADDGNPEDRDREHQQRHHARKLGSEQIQRATEGAPLRQKAKRQEKNDTNGV